MITGLLIVPRAALLGRDGCLRAVTIVLVCSMDEFDDNEVGKQITTYFGGRLARWNQYSQQWSAPLWGPAPPSCGRYFLCHLLQGQ